METAQENQATQFTSSLGIKQVVHLQFFPDSQKFTATIRGVHFYPGKVKYDLGIWIERNTEAEDEHGETRIYNVDSCFVSPE